MKRLLTYLSIGFVFGFFSWSTNAGAQEKKPPVATEKPAGLRVMNGGHSWSTENSAPLCQAAGITGHMKLNKQGLNSGRIEDPTPLLEKGENLERLRGAVEQPGLFQPKSITSFELPRARVSDRLFAGIADPERLWSHRWRGVQTAPKEVGP